MPITQKTQDEWLSDLAALRVKVLTDDNISPDEMGAVDNLIMDVSVLVGELIVDPELTNLNWCENMSGLSNERVAGINAWISTLNDRQREMLRDILKEQAAVKEEAVADGNEKIDNMVQDAWDRSR